MNCWTIPARIIHTARWIINPWAVRWGMPSGPIAFVPPAPPIVIPPEVACVQTPGALGWLAPVRAVALGAGALAGAAGVGIGGYQGGYMLAGGAGPAPLLAPLVNAVARHSRAPIRPTLTAYEAPPAVGGCTDFAPLPGGGWSCRQIDYSTPLPTPTPVPEPSGALVLGAAVLALVGVRRR